MRRFIKASPPLSSQSNVSVGCRSGSRHAESRRYSYFDFDPDARSFICPLCKGCCNCASCLRKRKLSHLLDAKGGGIDKKQLEAAGGLTVQAWIEKAADQRETLPFDRVRLVDKDTDVISPNLPEPVDVAMTPVKAGGKKRRKEDTVNGTRTGTSTGNGIGNGSRGKKAKKTITEGGSEHEPVVKKLRAAADEAQTKKSSVKHKAPKVKVKQYDSDGDTVGGYSSDDMSSRLTSPPQSPSPDHGHEAEPESAVKRFAFPPRQSQSTNDFLSSIVDASHTPPFEPSLNHDHALAAPPTSQTPLMDGIFQSRTVYDAFADTIGPTHGIMPRITPDSAALMAMQRSNSAASAVPSPSLHSSAPPSMEMGVIHASTDEIPHVAPAPDSRRTSFHSPRLTHPSLQVRRSGESTMGWTCMQEWNPFPIPS